MWNKKRDSSILESFQCFIFSMTKIRSRVIVFKRMHRTPVQASLTNPDEEELRRGVLGRIYSISSATTAARKLARANKEGQRTQGESAQMMQQLAVSHSESAKRSKQVNNTLTAWICAT